VNKAGDEVAVVQVHPDAASLDVSPRQVGSGDRGLVAEG
jgi:hypothetical protein